MEEDYNDDNWYYRGVPGAIKVIRFNENRVKLPSWFNSYFANKNCFWIFDFNVFMQGFLQEFP